MFVPHAIERRVARLRDHDRSLQLQSRMPIPDESRGSVQIGLHLCRRRSAEEICSGNRDAPERAEHDEHRHGYDRPMAYPRTGRDACGRNVEIGAKLVEVGRKDRHAAPDSRVRSVWRARATRMRAAGGARASRLAISS
jgi:hypothetical protein